MWTLKGNRCSQEITANCKQTSAKKKSKMFFFPLTLHYMISGCLSLNISNTSATSSTSRWPFGSANELQLKCSFKSFYLPSSVIFFLLFVFAAQRGSFCALTEIEGCALISWHLTSRPDFDKLSAHLCICVCLDNLDKVCTCVCVHSCRG